MKLYIAEIIVTVIGIVFLIGAYFAAVEAIKIKIETSEDDL